jgi:hypothetical protein
MSTGEMGGRNQGSLWGLGRVGAVLMGELTAGRIQGKAWGKYGVHGEEYIGVFSLIQGLVRSGEDYVRHGGSGRWGGEHRCNLQIACECHAF